VDPRLTSITERLDRIQQLFGVPPWLLVLFGVMMFAGWSGCYGFIIVRCFKQKTYGIPVMNACMDIVWETIFTFNLAGEISLPLRIGNAFWMIPDSLIFLQVFLYGANEQRPPWLRKHFRLILILTLAASIYGVREFMWYTGDVYGVLTSWIMDIMLSTMMLNLFLNRPDMRGIPYAATWFKLLGNIGGALFCYCWWPAQFVDHLLPTYFSGTRVLVHEPPSYRMINILYLTVPVLDILLIYLAWKRRKELLTGTSVDEALSVT